MKLPKSTVAMRKPCLIYTTAVCSALLFTVPKITAQDPASTPPASDAANPAASDYVSRAEYDKLKAEHEAMKKELDALKTAVRQMANGTIPAAPAEAPPAVEPTGAGKQVVATTSTTEELRQEVEALK